MMRIFSSEHGFSIIECLVSIVLLALVGLGAVKSNIMSMVSLRQSLRNSLATQLAIEKLEELGAVNPTTLDSSDNSDESDIELDHMSFQRQVAVTVNADGSRTVQVSVHCNSNETSGSYTATNTFPLWGNT